MPLSKNDEIDLLTHIALRKNEVEHKDNCGQCAKQVIEAEEATVELKRTEVDFNLFSKRVERRWKETKYYKFFQELKDQYPEKVHEGRLEASFVEQEFAKKGWEL